MIEYVTRPTRRRRKNWFRERAIIKLVRWPATPTPMNRRWAIYDVPPLHQFTGLLHNKRACIMIIPVINASFCWSIRSDSILKKLFCILIFTENVCRYTFILDVCLLTKIEMCLWLVNAFIHKILAFDLPLWGFVHMGLCPVGFCLMGFCPCGLLSGYRLQHATVWHLWKRTKLASWFSRRRTARRL